MDGLRTKWRWMVTLAWVVAAASVLVSIWLGFQFGTYEATELNAQMQNEVVTKINMGIILGCAVQALASILFGLMFTVLNEIYQGTVDIYQQNQQALKRRH